MGRYIGPDCKICRRNRVKLYLKGERCQTSKCAIERRNYAPGLVSGIPRKLSEYGRRLREKQKLRFFYSVSEKQIKSYFEKARRQSGVTGNNLLNLFELRLDNFVFRSKLAESRNHARQLAKHNHFLLNGKKQNIPSAHLRLGDVLSFVKTSESKFKERLATIDPKLLPAWIAFDSGKSTFTVVALPKREEIDAPVEEHLIVEFYSR